MRLQYVSKPRLNWGEKGETAVHGSRSLLDPLVERMGHHV
jgi:hypothetical protein